MMTNECNPNSDCGFEIEEMIRKSFQISAMEPAANHVKTVRIVGRGVHKFSEFVKEVIAKPLRFCVIICDRLSQVLLDRGIEFDGHRVRLDCTR